MEQSLNNVLGAHSSPDEVSFSPHFCRGHLPVAFVFSAPGKEEVFAGRPVAGDTGTNLDLALVRLHSAQAELFRSLDRYDYRITNASSKPFARSLGHSTSEAPNTEIRAPRNVRRVLQEVEDCRLVVLGGKKAGLLAQEIQASRKTVVEVPHVGNQGLNGTFEVPNHLKLATPLARREHRVQLWADAVLRAIAGESAQHSYVAGWGRDVPRIGPAMDCETTGNDGWPWAE